MSKKPLSPEAIESREIVATAGAVAHIEAEYRKAAQQHRLIDEHLADDNDNSEWTELKRTLKFQFPDVLHAKYQDLTAKQKLWAVADCEGWSQNRFSEISGVPRSTVQKWTKRADWMLFQRDYKAAQGVGDPRQEYAHQAHKARRFFNEILDMPAFSLEEKQFKFKVASYVTDKIDGNLSSGVATAMDLKTLSEALRRAGGPPVQSSPETQALPADGLFVDNGGEDPTGGGNQ